MALIRILVDGYSLLHRWPELRAGRAPHTEAAREALIRIMSLYQDATGTPVTIFFDGVTGPKRQGEKSKNEVEVLFSKSGQTADQMIERATHRFADYGEVLVISDDTAERGTVLSVGGMACGCLNFIAQVESTLGEIQDDIKQHNRRENRAFGRRKLT